MMTMMMMMMMAFFPEKESTPNERRARSELFTIAKTHS